MGTKKKKGKRSCKICYYTTYKEQIRVRPFIRSCLALNNFDWIFEIKRVKFGYHHHSDPKSNLNNFSTKIRYAYRRFKRKKLKRMAKISIYLNLD